MTPTTTALRATRPLLAAAAAASLLLAGCANMSDNQRYTATSVGIGTAAGAVVGGIAGDGRGAAIGATLGGLGGYVWSQRMERQRAEMDRAMADSGVVVTQTQDNRLKLNIPSDISFDTNRAEIKPQFAPLLDQFAFSLQNNPGTDIVIVGHTDSTGNDAINNPLSFNRAESTRQYLIARGVAAQRIQIDGRGSHEPVATNATAEGRSRNRRVEIYVGEPAQAQPQQPQPPQYQPQPYPQQPQYQQPQYQQPPQQYPQYQPQPYPQYRR